MEVEGERGCVCTARLAFSLWGVGYQQGGVLVCLLNLHLYTNYATAPSSKTKLKVGLAVLDFHVYISVFFYVQIL